MRQTIFFIENGEGYDDFTVFGAVIGTESDRDKITKIMESVFTDYHTQSVERERRDEEEWRKFRVWMLSPEGTKKGSIYKERLILDWIDVKKILSEHFEKTGLIFVPYKQDFVA